MEEKENVNYQHFNMLVLVIMIVEHGKERHVMSVFLVMVIAHVIIQLLLFLLKEKKLLLGN